MGLWNGRYLSSTRIRIYGGCSAKECYHTATIIHSDEWAAYRRVNTLPGIVGHNTVNHSLNFVDPVSGTHTQNVESYWSRAKQKIKRMKGCHAEQLPSYLDEFTWRERHGSSAQIAFFGLMTDIAQQYPV